MKRLILLVEFKDTESRTEVATSIESLVNFMGDEVKAYALAMNSGETYGAIDRFQFLGPIAPQDPAH